jgi:glycosyltransferase involved in cell wall biosynthesis
MRVLFLNPLGEIGGGERCLLDIMQSLRRADPGLDLHLALGGDGPMRGAAEALGVRVTVLEMPSALARAGDSALAGRGPLALATATLRQARGAIGGLLDYAGRLGRLANRLAPDIVHSNGLKCHLLTKLADLGRARVFWHVQDYMGSRRLMRPALRWAATRADTLVGISRSIAGDTRAVTGHRRVRVLLSAVDVDRFRPGGETLDLDAAAGLPPAPPGTVRAGLVATYARWKGHETFLAAAARLGDLPAARFYIVGGPIYKTAGSQYTPEELKSRAAELGLAGRIGFVPFQSDTAAVYRSLDVVVHASVKPEPFGLVIAEAMACGRAVIVSAAGGAAELFTDGVDALGHAPADVAGLAAALRTALSDHDLRRGLGEAARRSAETKFRRERLGVEMLALYRERPPRN